MEPDGAAPEPAPAGRRPPTPPTRRGRETRSRLLDAAAHCFAAAGYAKTSFEDVAARAGVSRSLVYAYFEHKEDLLRWVRDRALESWSAAVEPALRRARNAEETLRGMLEGSLEYARERPFVRALLVEDARVVLLGAEESSRTAIDLWRERLAEVLRRGVEAGEFRADLDVDHSADVMRAMQLGIMDRMHRQGPIDVASRAHVAAAVEILVRGLR